MPIIPEETLDTADVTYVQRLQTIAFIDTDPLTVALIPRARVKRPTGGFELVDQTPRQPQTMRLLDPASTATSLGVADGVQRELRTQLVARWDAVIEKYDRFTAFDAEYEVLSVSADEEDQAWEKRAEVVRFG